MGMDLNIYSARNREVFKHEGWWESTQVQEEFYARKFWDLVDNLEEMIRVACTYRDYFGTYNNVPKLCELRDKYAAWEADEDPRKLFLEYDW